MFDVFLCPLGFSWYMATNISSLCLQYNGFVSGLFLGICYQIKLPYYITLSGNLSTPTHNNNTKVIYCFGRVDYKITLWIYSLTLKLCYLWDNADMRYSQTPIDKDAQQLHFMLVFIYSFMHSHSDMIIDIQTESALYWIASYHIMTWYDMICHEIWYDAVEFNAVQYNVMQYDMTQIFPSTIVNSKPSTHSIHSSCALKDGCCQSYLITNEIIKACI